MNALKQKPKCPHLDPWAIKTLDQNLVLKVQTHRKLRTMAEAEELIREELAKPASQAIALNLLLRAGATNIEKACVTLIVNQLITA